MMIYVCLWSPRWATGGAPLDELGAALLEVAPRVAVEGRGVIWADARGLPAREIARELLARSGAAGGDVRAGVSAVPVAAELAARGSVIPGPPSVIPRPPSVIPAQAGTQESSERELWVPASAGMTDETSRITPVPPGAERDFLAPLPLELLAPDPRLLTLLYGVGIHTCGDLAGLARESVEVRFGADAGALWRLARADDRRVLFRPIPRERPHASMDFVEYQVREAGRLVFTVNALLGSVCETLDSRGERARAMTLVLSLSSGDTKRERLRSARPTADRDLWIRRLQELLDRLRLPEPVVGLSLEVDETEPRSATQGDLFDRGFATAGAVEEAVARLLDEQGSILLEPEMDSHPLAERRTRWVARSAEDVAGLSSQSRTRRTSRKRGKDGPGAAHASASSSSSPSQTGRGTVRPDIAPAEGTSRSVTAAGEGALDLTLHLLREPRPLGIRIAFRGVQILPEAYSYAGAWHGVAVAAGPDRLSGGRWEAAPFARDYFRCLTEEGRLVWIYRDLDENRWYLHGWWE